MELYDIVKKLIGEIDPIGDTHLDEQRYDHLCSYIDLVEKLLSDLYFISGYAGYKEASMKKAGEAALNFFKDMKEEYFKEEEKIPGQRPASEDDS
jgi:hypothetical protein